jgi:hypothetical protein
MERRGNKVSVRGEGIYGGRRVRTGPRDDAAPRGRTEPEWRSKRIVRAAGIVVAVVLATAVARRASADARVAGFAPSRQGLHFANAWPNEPDVTINFLGFSIPIGNAAQGLCGGMVFTVRDFFESGYHIPVDATNPPSGAPLFNYIFNRLIDSFDLPNGAARNYNLQAWWTSDAARAQTMVGEWSLIKADLDRGVLSPMSLIRVHADADPFRLGENHQVLAHAYEQFGTWVWLHVYDPNHPNDDNQWIWFDAATGSGQLTSDHEPLYSFFRTNYVHRTPVPTRTSAWFNSFEGADASAWWTAGNAGIDVARGLSFDGSNNGWARAPDGWNAVNATAATIPGATCTATAWLRTTPVVNGYFSTRSSATGPVLNEIHVTGMADGAYHLYAFDFLPDAWSTLLYAGLWGNGTDTWIQTDRVAVTCNAWN